MSKQIVDSATGEVVQEIKFRSMWCNPYGIEGQDLSNEIEDVYTEVPAFAVDPETGDFMNKSSVPQLVKTGSINVKEKIQSFAKDVDIYSILERFAYNEDASIINARACSYGDISELPDNLNDYAKFVDIHFNKLKELNPELAKMVLDENVKPSDIEAKAQEIFNNRVAEQQKKEGNE